MEHLHSITGIHMWLYKGLMRTVHDMLSCWWVKITTYYRGDWVKRERGSGMSEATKRKMYTRCTPNSIKNCLELNLCNLILFRLMRMDADGIYTYIYARTRMHASTFTFRHPLHIKLWFVFVLWCKMCKDTLLFLLVHKIKRGFCLTYFCLPAHLLLSFFSHPCVCVCVAIDVQNCHACGSSLNFKWKMLSHITLKCNYKMMQEHWQQQQPNYNNTFDVCRWFFCVC